jgi:hypothetical protein
MESAMADEPRHKESDNGPLAPADDADSVVEIHPIDGDNRQLLPAQPSTQPAAGEAKPEHQPLRVIVPEDPPVLTPAAALVLLRILRAAEPQVLPGQRTSDPGNAGRRPPRCWRS